MKLRMATAALALSGTVVLTSQAKAVDLDEHSKYLAFIEGFQYFFEFCQAETTLPEPQNLPSASDLRSRDNQRSRDGR